MAYDYKYEVTQDVLDYIKRNIDLKEYTREELEEKLNDDLWTEDSVTGNASGSYYCNSYKAWEALYCNLDLLGEALSEFGCDASYLMENGEEACDVTIRCYVLPECIRDALDEFEDEDFKNEDEECDI